MTKNDVKNAIDEQAASEGELKDEHLENVTGGAFLRGAANPTATFKQPSGGSGNLAAESATTLECWHKCTVSISGC